MVSEMTIDSIFRTQGGSGSFLRKQNCRAYTRVQHPESVSGQHEKDKQNTIEGKPEKHENSFIPTCNVFDAPKSWSSCSSDRLTTSGCLPVLNSLKTRDANNDYRVIAE